LVFSLPLVAGACAAAPTGGATPTAAPVPVPSVRPHPKKPVPLGSKYLAPAHYRALFEPGREWTYRVTSTKEFNDPDNPSADRHGNVRESDSTDFMCVVSEVRAFRNAIASEIACAGGEKISGIYGATAEGLFQLSQMPEQEKDVEKFRAGDALIAATPRPEQRHEKYPEGEVEKSVDRTPEGYWCKSQSDTIGDEGSLSICFGERIGIVSYSSSWAGGSSRELMIELVR
jgi:hypothetical protein